MPEYNFNFDWNRVTTIGKVKVLAEQVSIPPTQAQIDAAVAAYIEAHPGSISGLSEAAKVAILQLAEKVVYIDEHGQDYYDALYDAFYPPVELTGITAVYTQSGTVYDTDTLDSLKSDLVVTAVYSDATTEVLADSAYTLSGTLAEGTSTITATYEDKTTTFNVTVTRILYPFENGTHTFTTYPHTITVEDGNVVTVQHAANNHDIKANVSTVSTNGTIGNESSNYDVLTPLFTLPSGSTIRCVVIPKEVTYSNATMGGKSVNFIFCANGAAISGIAFMYNQALNSLVVDTPIVNEFTASGDIVVGCIGTWMGTASSATAKVKAELQMYVDGVRWI